MRLPTWLWGHAPDVFFKEAGLHASIDDREAGTWKVRTEERHTKVAPNLLELHNLAGPGQKNPRFDRISNFAGPPLRPPLSERESEALEHRFERVKSRKGVVDAINLYLLQTVLVDQRQLSEIVEHVYNELISFRIQESPSRQAFPNASVHVVRRRDQLTRRIKIASVLARIEYDTRLASGDLTVLRRMAASPESNFAASENLVNGTIFLEAYFGPLLGSFSPFVWSFHAAREMGLVVYSLGEAVRGTDGAPVELLQLLPSQGALESVPRPELTARAGVGALEWWSARLNRLFGVLSDPAVFTDKRGVYDPMKHIQGVSTAEQLFRRITSIQVSYRDAAAGRGLFFSILDTLERLTARNIDTHCSIGHATKTLRRIENELPLDVAEVVLPMARRGVRALREVQNGFYLLRQSGQDCIEVVDPSTSMVKKISPERATADYIKMLRNATHGFGSNKSSLLPITNALLAHHDGNLSHDLPCLGYLYLIDLLMYPDIVGRVLHR